MTTSKGYDNEKSGTYTIRYDGRCDKSGAPIGNLSVLCKDEDGLSVGAHLWQTSEGWEVDTINADAVLEETVQMFSKRKQAMAWIEEQMKEAGYRKARW